MVRLLTTHVLTMFFPIYNSICEHYSSVIQVYISAEFYMKKHLKCVHKYYVTMGKTPELHVSGYGKKQLPNSCITWVLQFQLYIKVGSRL